jgi:hypothetical protein
VIEVFPGIQVDSATCEFQVLGHPMAVGCLDRRRYRPGFMKDERLLSN